MDRINEMSNAAVSPALDVIKNSALSKLDLSTAEMLAAKQQELIKFDESFKMPVIDPALFNLEPIPVELREPTVRLTEPVRVELPGLSRNWTALLSLLISLGSFGALIYFGTRSLG